MKKSEEDKIFKQPCISYKGSDPKTAFELINRYGTYEVQATSDTENQYPMIAQGFNKKIIETDCENPAK